MTDPAPDSLCVCCDAPATHTDHNGHTRCEQHRLPTDDSLAEARRLMNEWAADGSLPTWRGSGKDLEASIARSIDERQRQLEASRETVRLLEKDLAEAVRVCDERHKRIAELEAEVERTWTQ